MARKKMEEERLENTEKTLAVKLEVQQAEVERRRTMAALRRSEATGLKIRAGVAGVLQEVPVQVGQRISPGTNLARVVDPTRLKAQLQIAETQVKDVVIGQKAEIDTRNGITRAASFESIRRRAMAPSLSMLCSTARCRAALART